MIHARAASRVVGGLLALALATTACDRGGDRALKIRTGGLHNAPATAPGAPPAETAAPPETSHATPSKQRRITVPKAVTQTAARATSAVPLTLLDTGYTRVRVAIDSHAAWVSMTLDNTAIQASKVIETGGGAQIMSLGPTITVKNPGRAVIDFVLQIPVGAPTGLSMCKNYEGPATVTVTRLTNAPTDVATVTNAGNDAHPPQGQCENQLRRDINRAALIGPVRWPARQDARPLVLAHYFPWYDTLNLQQTFGPDAPAYPANTNDPATVASAVDLASRSGIDAFIVEYEGTQINTDRIPFVVAAADAKPGFKLAYTIDIDVMQWHGGGQITPDALDAGLRAVTAWVGHPSQLFTNGKPVIFVYGADKIAPADWQAGLARLRAASGVTPYVVADDAALGAPGLYWFGTYGLKDPEALNNFAHRWLWRNRLSPGLDGQAGPLWAAPVSPGYDDRGQHRQQSWSVDRAGGQRYDQEWSAALAGLPDWVVITTWNEYYEQTHIAPGTTSGGRALAQTAQWAARFHTTG